MSKQGKILRVCDSYDQFFDLSHLDGETVIVCPSPVIADSVAQRINDVAISTKTISQFSRENLRHILGDEIYQEKFQRKSSLNLSLSTLWKIKAMSGEIAFSSSLYTQAFNLYTELRSYTLDLQVLEAILELYPQVIQTSVTLFIDLIDQMGILDEHAGYQIITENARSTELDCLTPKEKNIIFWGFDYYSGIQIDMIRSLAIRNRVEVPITRYLYGQSIKTDWVQWFDTEVVPDKNLLKPLQCQKIEIGKNRLSIALKTFWEENKLEQADILIAQKNPSMAQLSEVSINRVGFKVPIDLLASRVEQIFSHLRTELEANRESRYLITSDVLKQLQESMQNRISSGEQLWRDFRSEVIVFQVIREWEELSQHNAAITAFDLEALEQSALLNTTRNFQYNMVKDPVGRLVGLEGLESIDTQKDTIICATQNYGRLNTTGTPFVKGVNEILQDVAPLRRFRFEFEAFKEKLCQILRRENCYLFIEKDLEKIDRGWAEILSLHESSTLPFFIDRLLPERADFLAQQAKRILSVEKISASKLQSYLECPSKYYFQRNEPLDTFYSDSQNLAPADLGQLEHEVIEYYFKDSDMELGSLDLLVSQRLDVYISKNSFELEEIKRQSYHQEIKMYAMNGILLLEKIQQLDPSIHYKFERKKIINRHGVTIETRVDCLVEGAIYRGVIDFKRSSSSIASAKKVLAFEKIQLPFYVHYHMEDISKINIMGYICLADPTESKFWSPDKEIAQHFYSALDKKLSRPKDYVIEEWEEFFEKFDTFIHDSIEKLKMDTKFEINPIDEDACTYCPVNYLCSKEGTHV